MSKISSIAVPERWFGKKRQDAECAKLAAGFVEGLPAEPSAIVAAGTDREMAAVLFLAALDALRELAIPNEAVVAWDGVGHFFVRKRERGGRSLETAHLVGETRVAS
jgi:hypothetical protein